MDVLLADYKENHLSKAYGALFATLDIPGHLINAYVAYMEFLRVLKGIHKVEKLEEIKEEENLLTWDIVRFTTSNKIFPITKNYELTKGLYDPIPVLSLGILPKKKNPVAKRSKK